MTDIEERVLDALMKKPQLYTPSTAFACGVLLAAMADRKPRHTGQMCGLCGRINKYVPTEVKIVLQAFQEAGVVEAVYPPNDNYVPTEHWRLRG